MMLLRSLLLLSILFAFTACGGGGGGDDDTSASAATGTGSVALLVRDAPLEGLEALIVTITSAELLGDGAPVTIFTGSRRVNLLKFQEQEFILALRDRVPVGTYDKIRLRVENPVIEPNPGNLPVRIPGNGKLDLNPRSPFRVVENGFLTIRIDFDANNSVHVVQTGSGHINVRPVIFVEIEENFPVPIDLHDFSGTVVARDLDQGSLRVDVDGRVGEILVKTDADTTIFDSDVEQAGLAAIGVGDRVLVRGSLDRRRHVIADVIFRGDPLQLSGLLPDGTASDPFLFVPDADQAISGDIAATLVGGARAYMKHGKEILLEELEQDSRACLTGRFFANQDLYKTGMIDVEARVIEGVIEAIALGAAPATISVREEDDSLTIVSLDRSTEVRLVGGRPIAASQLEVGQSVEVMLDGELGGLPYASRILVDSLRWEGTVVRIDSARRQLLLAPEDGGADLLLSVREDATILLVVGDTARMIDLDAVMPGDTVDALGLLDDGGAPTVYTLILGL